MRQTMILTGEINLKTVTDPAAPFARVAKELNEADLVFANLECMLADPPAACAADQVAFHAVREGFYADPVAGEALKLAGFDGVGCANNVTYGEDGVRASLARLKELGIRVVGAGPRPGRGVQAPDHREKRRPFRLSAAHLHLLAARPGGWPTVPGSRHPSGSHGVSTPRGEPARRRADHPDHGRRQRAG